ncbi:hypothetical protein B0P06_004452 [Clostridium saccharoperbutylacetonicum]|uniref:Peptidase C39-like domain-containing protein n=2 Tax=Clostridium saccharoperbutylacetonicum TaxID=36745 RepID=M1LVT3_9CLOT|nr:hypothetical protein [Clostridium saccharoperbutylacetonicum]AGF57255.1 hypothetical protein Cspa_c34940 [Clostridium saccharoperbutylacetonicum N1-4(HMT)]NRT61983.1 hypothetical protein [Clostridium saccharoperbutylacetonicum]NSB44681.1 hypothetical protein [Clostridium saccharoperbutylacetonicum]
MKPYISQTIESNSCGAHSIAYYLWETTKAQSINDRTFVANIHKKIQIGPNNMGIPEIYSNPEKIAYELSNNWSSYSYTCMLSNSTVIPIAKNLNISTKNIDIIDKVKKGANKYAIIICSIGYMTPSLHYMLIKYEQNTFKLLDSLYNLDHSTFKILDSIYGIDHVIWEDFTIETNNKLTLDRNSNYFYTGAGILID